MSDFDQKKEEVLSRIEIKTECEAMGIQFKGEPSGAGWITCFNPYKQENNPSCGINVGQGSYRGWFCAFNMTGKPSWAVSFWDLCKDFHPQLSGREWFEIFQYYADKTGVSIKKKKLPKPDNVEFYQSEITKEVRGHLHENRGLTDETIAKFEIGWSTNRERLSYPVYDSHGKLVNIRFHAWKKNQTPKTKNWTGCGQKRLWGVDRLAIDDGNTVCITEGEWDAMLLEQETGILSVSPTNGAGAFDMDWVKFFHNRHVVLVWDCDKEGRDAVDKIIKPAFRGAIRRGEVLSLKTVWLFDEVSKNKKDFTDYIIKAGGSGKEVLRMIEDALPVDFKEPSIDLPDPIVIKSFKDIDQPEYAGKRVTCPIFIHGENSEAYHAPTEILVGDCPLKKKIGCNGRQDWGWTCDAPITIKNGSRIQLACVQMKDHQVEQYLRKWVCDRRQKCDIIVDHENHITIREVFAHQVISSLADSTRLVEKAVYVLGGDLIPIGQYKATGTVYRHPKSQQPTMLIDTLEPQEEDWQAFDIEEKRPLLRELQKLDITTGDILEDLMYNHTHIHKRYDLHLATLLTLCSPLRINLPDEGQVRGWISSIIIGDTGTGKSDVVDVLLGVHQDKKSLDKIGYRVAGQTASRTGITYGLDHDEKRGWRLKAGAMLKQSGQVLNVDEAQDIAEEELKTMADAIDKGRLKIDRIVTREFKAETRCLFTCNPIESQKRKANQKPIAAFQYGCQAVKDIFPVMMLRRIDLCCFAASTDIAISAFTERRQVDNVVTAENFKALVHYAWNLRPEQIIISDEAYRLICREATRLSEIFGKAADLPIVYAEDFRKTFARICVAAAVVDLNSDDDFETITVEPKHIMFMSGELEDMYAANNCQLDKYAGFYREENVLTKEMIIYERLKEHCKDAGRRNRIEVAINELIKLDPSNPRNRLSQVYLKSLFDKDRTTIFRDIQPLIRDRLVNSSRGYLPTPKLFQFLHWLDDNYPDFLNYKDPEIETVVYG